MSEHLDELMVGSDIVVVRDPYWIDVIHSDGNAIGGLSYDEAHELGLALIAITKSFMEERKRRIEEEIHDEKEERRN